MSRLAEFESYRFIGTRDTMRVYDCDDGDQFEALRVRVGADQLLGRNLLQSFAPDSIDEAADRGFKPIA